MLKIFKNKYVNDVQVFLYCWLFYGIIANIWVQFPDWDWFNYQHYNAWAFLNDRIGTDFMAASIRSYFNPYINVIQYLLLQKLNYHPRIFLFISTIDGAFLMYLTYKISNLLFDLDKEKKKLLVFLILVYSTLSPIMFDIMNFSRYDGYIAVFELFTLYILLKYVFCPESRKRTLMIILSGISLGVATALKLSAFIYCVTVFVCILLMYKKIEKPIKVICVFSLSIVLSFLLVDGYWLYTMYHYFKNPVFPHFNNIFKSEFYDNVSVAGFDYLHYKPKNIFQFIFYPFYTGPIPDIKVCFGSDNYFTDYRYAMWFVCAICLLIMSKLKKITIEPKIMFVLQFMLLSYYINLAIFGVYRFIIATSVLFGILLLLFIIEFLKLIKIYSYKNLIIFFLMVIFYAYYTQYIGYNRYFIRKFDCPVLKISDADIEDNSVVFVTPNSSVVIPNQNKNAKYIGYVIPQRNLTEDGWFIKRIMGLYYEEFIENSKYEESLINEHLKDFSKKYILYDASWRSKQMPMIYKHSLLYYNKNYKLNNCKPVDVLSFNDKHLISIELCEIN